MNITRFHPDDVVFWEIGPYDPNGNIGNDSTNNPDESIIARHAKGTCLGHIDGHAEILSAVAFSNYCQQSAPHPNQLYCSPLAADGGYNTNSQHLSTLIHIDYE